MVSKTPGRIALFGWYNNISLHTLENVSKIASKEYLSKYIKTYQIACDHSSNCTTNSKCGCMGTIIDDVYNKINSFISEFAGKYNLTDKENSNYVETELSNLPQFYSHMCSKCKISCNTQSKTEHCALNLSVGYNFLDLKKNEQESLFAIYIIDLLTEIYLVNNDDVVAVGNLGKPLAVNHRESSELNSIDDYFIVKKGKNRVCLQNRIQRLVTTYGLTTEESLAKVKKYIKFMLEKKVDGIGEVKCKHDKHITECTNLLCKTGKVYSSCKITNLNEMSRLIYECYINSLSNPTGTLYEAIRTEQILRFIRVKQPSCISLMEGLSIGVSCDYTIIKLLLRGVIEEMFKYDGAERPIDTFYRKIETKSTDNYSNVYDYKNYKKYYHVNKKAVLLTGS